MQDVLAATFGQPGSGKLDLNNASKALASPPARSAGRAGVPMSEPQLQKLVADILDFRDTPAALRIDHRF
jgi:hypothetical protein